MVLDGRNAFLADGVQRALGHEPIGVTAFVRQIADQGTWQAAGEEATA